MTTSQWSQKNVLNIYCSYFHKKYLVLFFCLLFYFFTGNSPWLLDGEGRYVLDHESLIQCLNSSGSLEAPNNPLAPVLIQYKHSLASFEVNATLSCHITVSLKKKKKKKKKKIILCILCMAKSKSWYSIFCLPVFEFQMSDLSASQFGCIDIGLVWSICKKK